MSVLYFILGIVWMGVAIGILVAADERNKLPAWYLWPVIAPLALAVAAISSPIWIPLLIVCGVATPYLWLYPERSVQQADLQGTEAEKARLARWRLAYNRLSFTDRIRRAVKISRRRGRRAVIRA